MNGRCDGRDGDSHDGCPVPTVACSLSIFSGVNMFAIESPKSVTKQVLPQILFRAVKTRPAFLQRILNFLIGNVKFISAYY